MLVKHSLIRNKIGRASDKEIWFTCFLRRHFLSIHYSSKPMRKDLRMCATCPILDTTFAVDI